MRARVFVSCFSPPAFLPNLRLAVVCAAYQLPSLVVSLSIGSDQRNSKERAVHVACLVTCMRLMLSRYNFFYTGSSSVETFPFVPASAL